MKKSTFLLVVNIESSDEYLRDMAQAAADSGLRLVCFLIGEILAQPPFAYGVPPYATVVVPDGWMDMLAKAREKTETRIREIEDILASAGAQGEVQSIVCPIAEIAGYVAMRARVCDVAFLAPSIRESPNLMREIAYGVLFQSPIALMANSTLPVVPRRVLIGWDSSKAASSAVHAALPYLTAAEEVTVTCFDPVTTQTSDGPEPGADVAHWLSHHGLNVSVSQLPSGGREIGQCIQQHAKEFGADLVVLGAYGHSRHLQAVFGGTTRSLLEQRDLPIIMAH